MRYVVVCLFGILFAVYAPASTHHLDEYDVLSGNQIHNQTKSCSYTVAYVTGKVLVHTRDAMTCRSCPQLRQMSSYSLRRALEFSSFESTSPETLILSYVTPYVCNNYDRGIFWLCYTIQKCESVCRKLGCNNAADGFLNGMHKIMED